LTYSVAHDLRAPLRSLQSFADLLQEDYGLAFDATAQDYLQRIRRNATRMDTLIRDLLAYSHLSATEFQRQPVALDAIVSVVLADLADTIKASGAAIAVDAPLPAVLTHEPILVQVVLNLLTNALKFVAPGTPPVIRVRAECRAPDVRIWVEDNGLGIPAEHQERIFRPFERLHSGEHYPGTGIGLAIVRRSLERLGGAAGGGVSSRGGQPLLVRAAGRARDVAQEDGHGVDSDPRGG
jgi:signal transduction histidine kinase